MDVLVVYFELSGDLQIVNELTHAVPTRRSADLTSAFGGALRARSNLMLHWRAGNVKWCCASVFTATGVLGAAFGAGLAQVVDGGRLLSLFGMLMIGVGVRMLLPRRSEGDPHVRISALNARRLVPRLAAGGPRSETARVGKQWCLTG